MPETEHLIVDLQVGREAISGSVKVPSGEQAAFKGWLGLISIIERTQAHLGGRDVRGVNAAELPPDDELGSARDHGVGPS